MRSNRRVSKPLSVVRVARLLVGLALYGVAEGLMVLAHVGVGPWTVFATGLAERTGAGVGWLTNVIGLAVLLLWIPLRQKPGIGTVLNVLLVGTFIEATVDLLPAPEHLVLRVPLFAAGLVLLAVASGVYIGAGLGPGPRDGLMTGLHARTGRPIWLCRAVVEVSVSSSVAARRRRGCRHRRLRLRDRAARRRRAAAAGRVPCPTPARRSGRRGVGVQERCTHPRRRACDTACRDLPGRWLQRSCTPRVLRGRSGPR